MIAIRTQPPTEILAISTKGWAPSSEGPACEALHRIYSPFLRSLRALLAEIDDIEVVGEAGDGDEALRLAAHHRPDVVIMDLHRPGMSGIETTRNLLARQPVPESWF